MLGDSIVTMARWSEVRDRYIPPGFKYLQPERVTSSVARANRLNALLAQDRRFAEIKNFNSRLAALSPAPKKVTALTDKISVKGRAALGPKAALIAAALNQFKDKDFSDPRKRAAYRELRRQQEALRVQANSMGGRKNVPSGSNKKFYDPTGKAYAVKTTGVLARYRVLRGWQQAFANPPQVVPCIQRLVRREVMFANGRAGKGYRGPKRRDWKSGIPC